MAIHWGGKGPGHVSRWPRGVGAISPYSGATMLLDFLNPTLDPRITFTRGSNATRVNASGFIETVGNNVARFDYDPVTLAPRGLLIEEQRTNNFTYSEDFTNAAWVKSATTITANTTVSPAGTSNAALAVPSATVANHDIAQTFTAAAVSYTLSVYAKAQSYNFLLLLYFDGVSDRSAYFNLSTGTIGSTATLTTPTITPAGNGWYRCAITFTGVVGRNNFVICAAPSDGGRAVAGNGTSGVYLWGADLEAGSFATSYIPTVASQVTRSADVATMTGTNFSNWFNQSEGTFVADASFSGSLASNASPFAASGDLNNYSNWIAITRNATTNVCSYNVIAGGVAQSGFTNGAAIANATPAKAALAYRVNDIAGSTNGAVAGTDTSATLPTLTRFLLGREQDGSVFLNGHIRTIAYFNTRLANDQLQTLTAPTLIPTLSLNFTGGSYNVGF